MSATLLLLAVPATSFVTFVSIPPEGRTETCLGPSPNSSQKVGKQP